MNRTLFRIEWQQIRNTWLSGNVKSLIVFIITVLISLALLYFLTWGALTLGHVIGSVNIAPALSIVFLIVLGFLSVFGVPQVFQQLFSATDLQSLFTMPISTRSIFLVKYAKSFFGLPVMIWLLMLVPLIGFGIGAGYSWLYYPVLFLVSAGITVIAVSVTYLINLGLVQVLPANRLKELMTVMGFLLMMLIYAVFQIPNFISGSGFSPQDLTSFGEMPIWLPTTFGAEGIGMAAQGEFGAWLPTVLVLLVAVFFAVLASSLVERGFRRGWIRLSEGRRKKVKQKKNGKQPLRHPIIFVGIKEWHSFRRDLREWLMFLPSLIFMAFPIVSMLISGGMEVRDHPLVMWLVMQALFLFIFGMLSGQLALASVGREGKASWILRVLPLSGRQITLGKFWISWLVPFLVLCLFEIILGIIFLWSWGLILAGIGLFAVLTLGINGIALWIGTLAPKYNPNNPQDRVQSGSRFLLMFMNLGYMVIAALIGVLILYPVEFEPGLANIAANGDSFINFVFYVLDSMVQFKAAHEIWGYVLGIAGLVVFSGGVAAVTLHFAAKRFDKGVHINIVQSDGGKGLFGSSPFSRNRL